jgi:plasmid stabilization system protein ParE
MDPIFHPLAQRDYRHHFEYLRKAHAGPETLQEFIESIRESKKKIVENSGTWSFAPGSKRVRRVQVPAFRVQVFYIVVPNDRPLILEIAGPGSRPCWHRRL